MEHTPTPWTYHIDYILDANNELVATGCKIKPQEESENNKLIVTAVNNHEKLVECLSELLKTTVNHNGIYRSDAQQAAIDNAADLLTTLNP